MASEAAQMPFIRNLASSDRKLRTSSLESLQTFLASRKTITLLDAQKLWKGLFYALWMTDRPIPQQNLAGELAALLFRLSDSNNDNNNNEGACAIPWLQSFWAVICAQWTEIDVLRLEKFLLLVRRVFATQIRFAKTKGYTGPIVDKLFTDVYEDTCFETEGDLRKVPAGIRLHVLDIWVDELEREGALADESDEAKEFVKRMGALVDLVKRCPVKPARARAAESWEDERLPWGKAAEEEDEEDDGEGKGDDDEWGGIDD